MLSGERFQQRNTSVPHRQTLVMDSTAFAPLRHTNQPTTFPRAVKPQTETWLFKLGQEVVTVPAVHHRGR